MSEFRFVCPSKRSLINSLRDPHKGLPLFRTTASDSLFGFLRLNRKIKMTTIKNLRRHYRELPSLAKMKTGFSHPRLNLLLNVLRDHHGGLT
jgi:hypothetical protein